VINEETNQCTELEILSPLYFGKAKFFLLISDQKQLGRTTGYDGGIFSIWNASGFSSSGIRFRTFLTFFFHLTFVTFFRNWTTLISHVARAVSRLI
jgi:hypothetical protein